MTTAALSPNEYRANSEPQELFVSLPDTIFEAVYGGEAGAGKSEALLKLPIMRGWYLHPSFKGILFRETFPELEKSLIPRAQELYEPLGGKWNGIDHVFHWPSGGRIWLSYIRNMKDARQHDTNEYNYIGWDEITHFEERVYRYLLHRCRSAVPELPHVMRAGATPGGKGNFWVYKRFIRPAPEGRRVLVETLPDGKQLKRIFVKGRLSDNVDLLRANPDYGAQIDMLPDAERRAKKGDWLAFLGQVFSEFRAAVLPGEPSNALHVIPAFEIPSWWPRLIAVDWGFSAFTCVLWAAVSPQGELYVYREYLARNKFIKEWAAEIKNLSRGEEIVACVIDPSASKRLGYEKTIKQQVIEATGMQFEDADNDRIGGKMLLHELMRWKNKPITKIVRTDYDSEVELRILRIEGVEAVEAYRASFRPEEPETNLPKFKVFDTCPTLVETIQVCSYEDNPKSGKSAEDVKEFDGDDPYDCVRYLAKCYHRFINTSRDRWRQLTRMNSIMENLHATGDFGAFHRQMSKYEQDEQRRFSPIVRRRGVRNTLDGSQRFSRGIH